MTEPVHLSCPKCRTDLREDFVQPGTAHPCPSCGRLLEGVVFPAYSRSLPVCSPVEAVVAAEDAGCFYHPQSRARQVCDLCGRFLCALCDVELQGRHVCPGCMSSSRGKKHIGNLDGDRILYGGIALMIAVLPVLIMWPVTFVTGPLAVVAALYGWSRPPSLTGPRRASFVFAIMLGLVETLAWGMFFGKLFKIF